MLFLKKVLVYVFLLGSYPTLSQSTKITVKLFKEDKEQISHKPLRIEVISCDTIRLDSDENSFLIADSLMGKQRTVVLMKGNLKLVFPGIYISWNNLLPQWIVKIDYAPINKDDYWSLPKQDIKRIKWRYTLEREDRTILSWHGFKKPFNY